MNAIPLVSAGIAVAAVAGVACAGLAYLGRRVVMPRPAKLVDAKVNEAGTHITLPLTPTTQAPGQHGLWHNTGHLRVGSVTRLDEIAGVVEREIVHTTGHGAEMMTRGRWSGHAFGRAEDVHVDVEEVEIPTEDGAAPAWLFPGPENADTWAIHVHGIRTSRFSALRTVPVALQLGMRSLVPSYYGDSDNLGDGDRPCYLGQREWRDVEAALDYAVAHGARRIILFGWSMGGSIALLLSERSRHRALISGIVLASPATDMRATVTGAARDAGLPAPIARLVPVALATPPLSRWSKLSEPIDFDALDWSTPDRLQVPTLTIHSDGDTDIPIALTQRFIDANPDFATLEILEPVPHQLEWNASPERFDRTISSWLHEHKILP
ncbi:hypothetical protein ATY41_05815 [Leifsonia xyli subsp. xyli]|uniref:Secreted protein n=2 Tax=Leifsonia xyli subsp. xyli TaxID=59736 RepID=Q6AEQ8_LEIXX|nr:alpha/beta hydrolase [Leifsonia xyli]AAT89138.1 secreted protein [Leifsonia xyli subsp. xyli str. CTCB07]ODA89423.1 hypothetical protein ATY41_05815 [Leifsonia xyli subsp. xyli]